MCCALHNYLLEVDGLDVSWEMGHQSEYEGRLGELSSNDLQHLPPELRNRGFYLSSMGRGNDYYEGGEAPIADDRNEVPLDCEQVRYVHKLPLEYFRSKLVEHFDIQFKRQEIEWPSHTGLEEPPQVL